jgi:dTMP kinase
MKGLFITFEGTEGSGKSTQIEILAERLRASGRVVRKLREPGGTPIGEEIRHTLKHSNANHAMMAETELLLMNASRAQLVREVIRPAIEQGEIILCDRFYDSTVAYQRHGRGLDFAMVRKIIACAVGETQPDLTLLLMVPVKVSEARRRARLLPGLEMARDRMEEADRSFFERVEEGYKKLAAEEPARVRSIDATASREEVTRQVWGAVERLLRNVEIPPKTDKNTAVDKTAASANVSPPKKKLSY